MGTRNQAPLLGGDKRGGFASMMESLFTIRSGMTFLKNMPSRWSFLEQQHDACSVVSPRMEILYLNAAASALVPPDWYGKPCWKVFPVGEASCASRCPAVKAVKSSNEIVYCEEHIFPANTLITLGVAIIPLGCEQADGAKSVLLLRPKIANLDDSKFKKVMLEEAAQLMERCTSQLQQ